MREDAATEADLVRAGYRDRLLTELAQNAADAATKAGVPGRLLVWLDGRDLHVANDGAPLDVSGVHALTALRASAKANPVASVGRFGVGFTAVLSVSDDIEVRSTTGSLHFSRRRTREALRANAITMPDSVGAFDPPVLRLAWPRETHPVGHADTEIVLRLRDDIDPPALLAAMQAEAIELLLELPALHSIRIGDDELACTVTQPGHLGHTSREPWLEESPPADSRGLDVGAGERNRLRELRIDGPGRQRRMWWEYRTARARWLLPLRDGRPVAADPDVLRAPTRSDEELSLPALLIADIPMQPDRRRLLPGARVAELAQGYADFARTLPVRDRLIVVPAPGFARSETDGLLREALVRELQTHSWLPVVAVSGPATTRDEWESPSPKGSPGSGIAAASVPAPEAEEDLGFDGPAAFGSGLEPDAVGRGPGNAEAVGGAVEVPTRASVFTGLTAELAGLLDDVVGPLVIPALSGRAHSEALGVLDVHRIGLARLAELSGGLERAPQWWYSLYSALEPFVVDPLAAEELGVLAVPLADGRLVTGPRTVVLDDLLEVPIPVHWARLAHPEAAHPLLARLGARSATAEDLLSDPGLRAELEDQPGDPDTADAVLRLAVNADPAALPSWLGMLELPDSAGELLPADELLLPGAPLRGLLVEDSPFGTAATDLVDGYGVEALRAVGVGWDFSVVIEEDPTGPDHHLDDEERWWSNLSEDPPRLAAVRDLDLVDETVWPEALRQLTAGAHTRRLLTDPDGYTAWWLRRHARIDGTPLGLLRHRDETEFADLLTEFAAPGLGSSDIDALRAVLANPDAINPELAVALLAALADGAKTPSPEVISRTHARLAAAVAAGHLDLADIDPPDRVRALSGAAVDPSDALVLDRPWFGLALPPDRLVFGDIDTAPALAALLDLPLISETVTAEVLSAGRRTTWSAEPLGVILRQLFTPPVPDGDLVLHEEDVLVRLRGGVEATVSVPWWRDADTTHIRIPQQQG